MPRTPNDTATVLAILGRQLDDMVKEADSLGEHALAAYLCHALSAVDIALLDKGQQPPQRSFDQ